MKTLKNKVCAIALVLLAMIPVIVVNDATALVFVSFFAIPMFFAKKNWIW